MLHGIIECIRNNGFFLSSSTIRNQFFSGCYQQFPYCIRCECSNNQNKYSTWFVFVSNVSHWLFFPYICFNSTKLNSKLTELNYHKNRIWKFIKQNGKILCRKYLNSEFLLNSHFKKKKIRLNCYRSTTKHFNWL